MVHRAEGVVNFYIDKTTLYPVARWSVLGVLLIVFVARILLVQGFYISAYALGIYLLNLFIGFLSPQRDEETENYILPVSGAEGEYRPFERRLGEFKFWFKGIRSTIIALGTTFFPIFDLPVFWPVLLLYFILLLVATMKHQIKDMITHGYLPFSARKTTYGDVGRDPIKRVVADRRDD